MSTKDKTLPIFVWKGKNKKGENIQGETSGQNANFVKISLQQQGIMVKNIRPKPKPLFVKKHKIAPKDISMFSRQMATMMAAGIPLVQSFDIVGKGAANPGVAKLIFDVKNSVENGSTLAESFAKFPNYFNKLYCNLVAAGEQSGCLEVMLDRIATYQEKTESIKAKIKKAMIYPIAVLVVAFAVTTILLIFVVPQFESLFKGFGAELPAPTRVVIKLSEFFQSYWWVMIGSVAGSITGLVHAQKKSEKFAFWLDRFKLKLPIVGKIFNDAIIARFTRTLGITFAAGMPLVDALDAVSGATGNLLYAAASKKIKEDVSTGQQLQAAMKQTELFPNMVIQMIAIGEESGSLEEMLSKVADFFEEAVDNAVDSLSSLLEPVILVFLAVIVGGLVISMYMPIFKLGSVV